MLTFAIPTWNRVKQLENCIRSIHSQAVEGVQIIVSDHGSTDGTWQRLNEMQDELYPYLQIFQLERTEKSDFQDNFQACFSLPQTRWTWTFGDDDLLLSGTLSMVLELLKKTEAQFIHVSELVRADKDAHYRRGTLLKLCNDLGWLDMTGFITCNIMKTDRLRHAVNHYLWEKWSKNAFPQSCALLEEFAHDQCMFVNYPIVDSQVHEQTTETINRWQLNQTATRYFYVDEALSEMVARGTFGHNFKFDNSFFRYHSYFIWDRLISNMISQYVNHPEDPHEELWGNIEGLVNLLDENSAKILRERITYVKNGIAAHKNCYHELMRAGKVLDLLYGGHQVERFGFTYTGVPAHEAAVVADQGR